jgi:hypothetical protein
MRCKKYLFLLLLLLGMAPTAAWAQAEKPAVKRNFDDPLVFKSIKNAGSHILVEYSVPFDGVVDFILRDADEKIVWRNQFVNSSGDNSIKFATKPLVEGKYFYSLFYKGNEVRKYFDYRATNE